MRVLAKLLGLVLWFLNSQLISFKLVRINDGITHLKVLLYGILFGTLPVSISYDIEDMTACNSYISGWPTSALYFKSSGPASYHNQLEPLPFQKPLIGTSPFFHEAAAHTTLALSLSRQIHVWRRCPFGSTFALEMIPFSRRFYSHPALSLSLDASQRSVYPHSTPWHSGPIMLRGGQPIFIHPLALGPQWI